MCFLLLTVNRKSVRNGSTTRTAPDLVAPAVAERRRLPVVDARETPARDVRVSHLLTLVFLFQTPRVRRVTYPQLLNARGK